MNDKQNRLLALLNQLPSQALDSLLDYAEFLTTRYASTNSESSTQSTLKPTEVTVAPARVPVEVAEPVDIPRPETESVIGAVKRLSATYHMLSKDKMLQHTASLVSESLMGGRETIEVIDELETIFLEQYEIHKQDNLE